MADSKPNVLIIVADDLGFSDLGCFGSEIKTPNLDSIAREGLRFTDFHSAAACSPTRSMLLSGTDNHIAGIGTMSESLREFHAGQPGYEGYLNDRVAALPELLSDAGYLTLMSGKWHLGLEKGRWPVNRGFDKSFTLLPGAGNHYANEPQLKDGDKRPTILDLTYTMYAEGDREIGIDELPEDFYSTDAFTDKLLQYFNERDGKDKEKPWFAYLPFSAPHWPLQAPEKDRLVYRGVYDKGPGFLRQERIAKLKDLGLVPDHAKPHDVITPPRDSILTREWDHLSPSEQQYSSRTMEVYAAMVQHMDTQIGRVLSHLRSTNELDNTLILFMSDNGAEGLLMEAYPVISGNIFEHVEKYYNNSLENLGARDSYVWYGPRWASAATAPGRLYKAFSSEGGIRVPLVLRYPPFTSERQGKIDHSFATVMDIMPTILSLAGISHPHPKPYKSRNVVPMRGKSWLPYFRDRAANSQIHDEDSVVGWELFDRSAIRKGIWKAVLIPPPYGPGEWQLYNLEADPGEAEDLKETEKAKLEELMRHWEEYVKEVGVVGAAPAYGVLRVG
ncbi:arylsulfatase [Polychaeton citri CBS 116435]|uniref:Arylsulfatase n=1 Tax=Polychaeton citri CBS 116435 TaxID=1314669 RepID=A0A9P4QF01_9PEZI|nr:arylsulfatase [Polychaeton citri CBS 116435]